MTKAKPKPTASRGARNREDARERSREQSADVREIGPLPKVKNPRRKARGKRDAVYFLKTYFPNRFYLGFGKPHLQAIEAIDDCVQNGGLHAVALMRGGGKTAITEALVLRAHCYGLRRYTVVIGATDPLAGACVKRLLRELESNPLLLEDFPEVCYPIRRLERITQRARGQTLNGAPTNMELTDGHLVLPTVARSAASGSIVQAFGLTGAIKGLQRLAPDGTPIRPDLVLIDDAQTRESAKSPTQTSDRERIICDDVMGLAGPRTKMSAVFLCTPIYPNDLTERFIDREKHPEWQGRKTPMVVAFPKNETLWDEYAEIRRESLRAGDKGERANQFYRDNRAAMDEGAELSWADRVKDGDESALQTAMNLRIDNPTGFASEYQCEPAKPAGTLGAKEFRAESVAARLSGLDRFAVPSDCSRITAFIDVGGELLWYAVVGWSELFGGSVLDYGCYPQQTRSLFLASDPRPGLSDIFPGYTEEQRVYAGLSALVPQIMGREYMRDGGQPMRIERGLIDSGWKPAPVYQFCAASDHAGILYPSKGFARSTTQAGVARWKPRPGERSGHHWRLTVSEQKRGRAVQFDPDAWKTFLHGALVVPIGGGTALTLYGKNAAAHEMIAQHCAAESSQPVTLRGETFDKWQPLPDQPDNHLLDCLVGCAVAASVQGLQIPNTLGGEAAPVKRKMTYAELRAQRKGQS